MKKTCLLFCSAALLAALLPLAGCAGNAASVTEETALETAGDCIAAEAVVHYYLENERHYFTQQRHDFCPDQKKMVIRSQEPQGLFRWNLQNGQYSASSGAPEQPGASDAYWNSALVGAFCCLMLYGGEFLSPGGSADSEPIKIEGQLYLEMKSPMKSLKLYRNQTHGKIDLVLVTDNNGTKWMAKSYNWSYYAPTGKMIPRKIDFFDISDGISSKKLKIRTDYAAVQ